MFEDLQNKFNNFVLEHNNQINKINNENSQIKEKLENEMNRMNRMNQEICNLKTEINNLKDELNTIEIRDKIRNLLKSFSYILSEEDKIDIDSKKRKRGEVFKDAFNKKFSQYNEKKKFNFLQSLLIKASDLYDQGNIFAHNLYSKNYKETIDNFTNEKNISNVFIPDEKILFLALCDFSNEYLEDSIEFVNNCLDKNFEKNFSRGEGDIYENFMKS